MSWADEHAHYQELAQRICPVARLTTKDGRGWQLAGRTLKVLSGGRFSVARFLEDFATTFGPIQAYPRRWSGLSDHLIAHEARHTQQFLFAGWFVPVLGWLGSRWRVWAGVLPMALVYGFFPVPIFFAWGRYRLELDADAQAWKTGLEEGWLDPDAVRVRARRFADRVSSWAYFRSWPAGWCRRGFARRAERVIESWSPATERRQ